MVNVLKSLGEGISQVGRVAKAVPKQVAHSVAEHSGPIRVAALLALVGGNAGCLVEFPQRQGACDTVGAGVAAGCDDDSEVCRQNMENPNDPSDLACYDRTDYCQYMANQNVRDIACPLPDALFSDDAAKDSEVPSDGAVVQPDAVVVPSDGAVVQPDAVVVPPDGAVVPPDGAVIPPDGAVIPPDGAVIPPDGGVIPPDAVVIPPDGAVIPPDGAVIPPDGAVIPPDGAVIPPDGAVVTPDADAPIEDAALPMEDGAVPNPDAGVIVLDAAMIPVDAAQDAEVDASPDAAIDAAIDAAAPDAEVVVPIDYCRIKIVEVLGGAGNIQLFCGPGTRQVDGNPNAYILGPDSLCDRRVAGMATEAWTLISPTRTTFQQEGDCSGLRVFSGDRADVPTDLPPTENAEELHFIIDPPRQPQLIIDGRNAGSDITTYFDARATNLSQ